MNKKLNNTSLIYSVSQLKLYDLCPLRYYFYYVERDKSQLQHIESFVGNLVHDALQHLYQSLEEGYLMPIGDLVMYYRKRWELDWHRHVRISDPLHGREWYRRYGEKCLRRYYTHHYPFQEPGVEVIGVEWNFQITLDHKKSYQMRGQLDRLSRREDGCYIVHDYKTGQYVPALHKLLGDLQPGVYQLAVRKTFPDAKQVLVQWHYVSCRRDLKPTLSSEELDHLQDKLIERIEHLEETQTFPPTPSPACRWCEYQHRCPAFEPPERESAFSPLASESYRR